MEETTEIASTEKSVDAKLLEAEDKYIRLYSEFDNFRKRTLKEKNELALYGGEKVLKSLLSVVDDFERSLKFHENDGVLLILNKLKSTLVNNGLTEIVSMGEIFNSDLHEAITNIESTDEQKGKVVEELEKGYSLNGKIIRFAKVIVGK